MYTVYTYKRHQDARGKRLNQAMKNDYMENGGPNGIAENRSARKAVMLLGRFCRFSSQTGPSWSSDASSGVTWAETACEAGRWPAACWKLCVYMYVYVYVYACSYWWHWWRASQTNRQTSISCCVASCSALASSQNVSTRVSISSTPPANRRSVLHSLTPRHIITFAKEVTFFVGVVSLFVCLFDCFCVLSGLRNVYSTNFHKIQWKGGTWTTEEIIIFWW